MSYNKGTKNGRKDRIQLPNRSNLLIEFKFHKPTTINKTLIIKISFQNPRWSRPDPNHHRQPLRSPHSRLWPAQQGNLHRARRHRRPTSGLLHRGRPEHHSGHVGTEPALDLRQPVRVEDGPWRLLPARLVRRDHSAGHGHGHLATAVVAQGSAAAQRIHRRDTRAGDGNLLCVLLPATRHHHRVRCGE